MMLLSELTRPKLEKVWEQLNAVLMESQIAQSGTQAMRKDLFL